MSRGACLTRTLIMGAFVFLSASLGISQEVVIPEEAVIWEDFEIETITWNPSRALESIGVFEGEGVDGSFGIVTFLNADSTAFWQARLQTSFEAPENAPATAWRVQYAAKTTIGPTAVSARLGITQDPWTSTEPVMPYLEIPAGRENRFFFFDFHVPVSPFLTTPTINFLFGVIGPMDAEISIDDIHVLTWDAIAMLTFESADPTAVAEAINGTLEQEIQNPGEGVYSIRMVVPDGGTTREDAELIALWTPYPDPHPRPPIGNYRLRVQARADKAPLQVQAGVIDRTTGNRFVSPTEQVIQQADTWQELSFLIKLESNEADEYGFFFDTGGQGAHTVTYDMVIIEPTEEEITGVDVWSLFY